MSIRQLLNEHSKMVAILCGIAIVTGLGFLIVQGGVGGQSQEFGATKAWYTDDDGRTWFVDDAGRVSPFDHNGKKAYRCYVWTCDGGKTKFVSHLERLKPERLKARQSAGPNKAPDFILPMDLDVKPPLSGESGWTDSGLQAGQAIRTPHCPSGQQGTPEPVEPK
jgi:hypothetical protein